MDCDWLQVLYSGEGMKLVSDVFLSVSSSIVHRPSTAELHACSAGQHAVQPQCGRRRRRRRTDLPSSSCSHSSSGRQWDPLLASHTPPQKLSTKTSQHWKHRCVCACVCSVFQRRADSKIFALLFGMQSLRTLDTCQWLQNTNWWKKKSNNNQCVCVYTQVACRVVLIWLCKMGLDQLVCISQESYKLWQKSYSKSQIFTLEPHHHHKLKYVIHNSIHNAIFQR